MSLEIRLAHWCLVGRECASQDLHGSLCSLDLKVGMHWYSPLCTTSPSEKCLHSVNIVDVGTCMMYSKQSPGGCPRKDIHHFCTQFQPFKTISRLILRFRLWGTSGGFIRVIYCCACHLQSMLSFHNVRMRSRPYLSLTLSLSLTLPLSRSSMRMTSEQASWMCSPAWKQHTSFKLSKAYLCNKYALLQNTPAINIRTFSTGSVCSGICSTFT